MLGQLPQLTELSMLLPWVSFLAGLGGSLHCVGMCGGLVTSSCATSTDIFRYQFGRLAGYLLLGGLGAFIGNWITSALTSPWISLVGGVVLGCTFIHWGVASYRGRRAEVPVPRLFRNAYSKLWNGLVKGNTNFSRPFFIGLISILLPCGLLYGMVISSMALRHGHEILISLFFFWFGTLPAMVAAPGLVRKILRPLQARIPQLYAIGLVMLGLVTISHRLHGFEFTNARTEVPVEKNRKHCH